jgi:bifunctional enzyme CysN/CysC
MNAFPANERMRVVVAGHVDHGKSTIIGRLLADTGSLPDGKLEQVRSKCERSGKPFEYAFILDALRDEQAQGITIDTARVFFKSRRRHYIILDAPGHVEFLKNMVTGAARAEAALLVIDAKEGIQENSKRHGYVLSLLGIRQLTVLVNKMDLATYAQHAFEAIETQYREFLRQLGLRSAAFIPVSALEGENLVRPSAAMAWYTGPTVIEALDGFWAEPAPVDKPLRLPVQDVYKFTKHGDDRRIVAGIIESGRLRVGDEVVFFPSGKKATVRSFEAFNRPPTTEARAGQAIGFTLQPQTYVARGHVATLSKEPPPHVTTRLRASLFWLGREPLVTGREYILKLGTARVPARVEELHRVVDAGELNLGAQRQVDRHQAAECTLLLGRAIAFDTVEQVAATSRFVVVDRHEICGGGVVREALTDKHAWVRDRVLHRNYKWELGRISQERRAEKYSQRAMLILVTGEQGAVRKRLAKDLEQRLFDDGKVVYFLGIGNVLYGVDADIDRTRENRVEHIRRLAEVANLMLDAGVILIVTAAELTRDELELIRTTVDHDRIETVWAGDRVTTDIAHSLLVESTQDPDQAVDRVKSLLHERGVIFQPW